MFKVTIILLFLNLTAIYAIRPVIDTTACNISSSFQKYFYVGLITEYKFVELKKAKDLIALINDNINDLVTEFNLAVKDDYNNRIIRIGYFTTAIELFFQKTLDKINYNNVNSSSIDVMAIVSLIKHESFKKVTEGMKKINDEIIIYKIIEESYKAERTRNPSKLMGLVAFVLQNGSISHAVTILLAILKEFTANSNNLYSYEMIILGELIFETNYRYQKYYYHQEEYDHLNTKIRYLRVSLPKIIENLTFGKFMKFCIINKRFNEAMFLDDAHYANDLNKRLVYTWNEGVKIESKLFNFIYDPVSMSYTIENSRFEEKMYTGKSEFYKGKNRYVLSQAKLNGTFYGSWELIPYNKKYFLIRNLYDLEYLYAHQENNFAEEFHKRRVFTWKGDLKELKADSFLWTLEDCA